MKPATTEPTNEPILEMLEQMLTTGEFEIFAKKQMNAGNLPGFIHMDVGQERWCLSMRTAGQFRSLDEHL